MDKIDDFKRQFSAIISNCELSELEFRHEMLHLAYEIADKYYREADSHSDEESFWDLLRERLWQAIKMIEPF